MGVLGFAYRIEHLFGQLPHSGELRGYASVYVALFEGFLGTPGNLTGTGVIASQRVIVGSKNRFAVDNH